MILKRRQVEDHGIRIGGVERLDFRGVHRAPGCGDGLHAGFDGRFCRCILGKHATEWRHDEQNGEGQVPVFVSFLSWWELYQRGWRV